MDGWWMDPADPHAWHGRARRERKRMDERTTASPGGASTQVEGGREIERSGRRKASSTCGRGQGRASRARKRHGNGSTRAGGDSRDAVPCPCPCPPRPARAVPASSPPDPGRSGAERGGTPFLGLPRCLSLSLARCCCVRGVESSEQSTASGAGAGATDPAGQPASSHAHAAARPPPCPRSSTYCYLRRSPSRLPGLGSVLSARFSGETWTAVAEGGSLSIDACRRRVALLLPAGTDPSPPAPATARPGKGTVTSTPHHVSPSHSDIGTT